MTTSKFTIQLYAAAATSPVNWRLLSGNNRECGRGVDTFSDAQDCRLALSELRRAVELGERRHRRVANRWCWDLDLDGVCIATAGHSFDRLVRCEQAGALFVAEFADAAIRDGLVLTGARRWARVAS